jgi:putative restriction endonuclease
MINGELSKHRSLTSFVVPDSSFIAACQVAKFRRQAREVLIETHFEPSERNALFHTLGLPIPTQDHTAPAAFFKTPSDAEIEGRNARFRLDVVSAYKYTCALTGYRVTTIGAGAIVDAAHIHQFSDSRNNDPRNGLALCKNAHWMFDIGLWSADDNYCVIVANDAFDEASPNQKPLREMNGHRLALPSDERIWPSKTHLAWHRERKFKGTT